MFLYVAETSQVENKDANIKAKSKIAVDELECLNTAFEVCGIYHSIEQIQHIVVENGEEFKNFMSEQNLLFMRSKRVSPERIIMLANKYVLNYASSVKTYLDMEKRILEKNKTNIELEVFDSMCNKFYDKHMEYRFWVNFRNYVVHCEFPYSIYREKIDGGCEVICTRERLLRYKKWKHAKNDILEMDEVVDLTRFVDNMNGMIYALYMDFFRYFHREIIQGIKSYTDFCRKYSVKNPVILKTEVENEMEHARIQLLPVKELEAAYEILKNHPEVEFEVEE